MKTLYLPGAGASASFWKPTADLLGCDHSLLSWPGLGNEPAHSSVAGLDDLVALVLERMEEPVNIVAQSMGGYVAIRVALSAPKKINRLVLTATSGGVPVSDLGGTDWRDAYVATYPNSARWITNPVFDLSKDISTITAQTLLIWGDHDAISPISVGQRLEALMPNSRLHVIAGGDHDLAQTHTATVARLIKEHLR